jgi:hypothetical protein
MPKLFVCLFYTSRSISSNKIYWRHSVVGLQHCKQFACSQAILCLRMLSSGAALLCKQDLKEDERDETYVTA